LTIPSTFLEDLVF